MRDERALFLTSSKETDFTENFPTLLGAQMRLSLSSWEKDMCSRDWRRYCSSLWSCGRRERVYSKLHFHSNPSPNSDEIIIAFGVGQILNNLGQEILIGEFPSQSSCQKGGIHVISYLLPYHYGSESIAIGVFQDGWVHGPPWASMIRYT